MLKLTLCKSIKKYIISYMLYILAVYSVEWVCIVVCNPLHLIDILYACYGYRTNQKLYSVCKWCLMHPMAIIYLYFWPAGMIPMRSELGRRASSGQFRSTPLSICVLQISPWMISLNMPSPPTHTTLSQSQKIEQTNQMCNLSDFSDKCVLRGAFCLGSRCKGSVV